MDKVRGSEHQRKSGRASHPGGRGGFRGGTERSGFAEVAARDPFLLLDCFHSDKPDDFTRPGSMAPHRGMETITYVLDGDVEHKV